MGWERKGKDKGGKEKKGKDKGGRGKEKKGKDKRGRGKKRLRSQFALLCSEGSREGNYSLEEVMLTPK